MHSILQLRDYQQRLIADTHAAMQAGHKRIMAVLATGGGKTAVFAWMAEATAKQGKSVWFLVHRRELLDQTKATFAKFGISTDGIHIGMVGQVARNADRFPQPDLIVFDEAHHSQAGTWRKIIDRYPDCWMIGLTATPCRLDGKPLGEIYQVLVEGPTAADLIDAGWLSPYRAYGVDVADLSQLRKRGADYDMEDASEHLMQRAIYGDVIEHYRRYADGLQALVFCATIRHSEATADALKDAGIRAVHLDGGTPADTRRRIVQRYRDGQVDVICSVDLLGEGFDVPACSAAILLRPTQSLTVHLQQIGRALRPADGKTAVILDHVGNIERLGLPDDPRDWSLTDTVRPAQRYTEQGELRLRTCTECLAVYAMRHTHCPHCGAEYTQTRDEIEQIREVELREIEQRRERRKQEWQARRTEELETEADCRSYQDLYLYAKRCGHTDPRRYAISRSHALGFRLPWQGRRVKR